MGFECCGEGAGARVAALAAAAPGPELVATLAEIDVAEVRCEAELLEVVAAWDRVVSWANARQLSAVAEFSRRPNVFRPEHEASFAARGPVGRASRQFGDDEIAARLGISRVAASARVEAGAALAGALSATGEALAAGATT